jgi:hypothetical protein
VAIGGALVIAAAAYAYGWHRGDAGEKPDLVPAATAKEEPRKTYYPNTEALGKNEMRVIFARHGHAESAQIAGCWLAWILLANLNGRSSAEASTRLIVEL